MPFRRVPSQPEPQAHPWLSRQAGRQLIADVQRTAIPELTRVFGQYGLYLRPSADIPPDLSGNMLTKVLSLQRQPGGFGGALACLDGSLPLASGSLSLVYALFVLESSPDPSALMGEIARTLKPEGVALVIGLNPWSPARLRWPTDPVRSASLGWLERLARESGLEFVRGQHLGPFWPRIDASFGGQVGRSWVDSFRAANLAVLRRREAGLTPLRKAQSATSLRPGMSAG
jgi:SAM-dependent methyltransferase